MTAGNTITQSLHHFLHLSFQIKTKDVGTGLCMIVLPAIVPAVLMGIIFIMFVALHIADAYCCFTLFTTMYIFVFIEKDMTTKFVVITWCLSESHAHVSPYHNVWP